MGNVWVGQQAYIHRTPCRKFGTAKPVATPVDTSTKMVKGTESCYQSEIIMLYLAMVTQPDITFVSEGNSVNITHALSWKM